MVRLLFVLFFPWSLLRPLPGPSESMIQKCDAISVACLREGPRPNMARPSRTFSLNPSRTSTLLRPGRSSPSPALRRRPTSRESCRYEITLFFAPASRISSWHLQQDQDHIYQTSKIMCSTRAPPGARFFGPTASSNAPTIDTGNLQALFVTALSLFNISSAFCSVLLAASWFANLATSSSPDRS